eukprot:m.89522 g.89522  ORF g.89522 m.89522 type:complete len:586 (+) comp20064_c0_seq2:196-1953(+)
MAAQAQAKLFGIGGDFEIGRFSMSTEATPRRSFLGFKRGVKSLPAFWKKYFAEHGDKIFTVYGFERLTYREFERKVAAMSRALLEKYQLLPGDRVGICMRNYPEWPMAYVAATSVGCVAVGMNSMWKGKELDYALRDSGCKVLFCDEERLRHAMPTLEARKVNAVSVRCSPVTPHPLVARLSDIERDFASSKEIQYRGGQDPDAPISIMYTSGTTGNPKGVVHTHRNICDQMRFVELPIAMENEMRAPGIGAPTLSDRPQQQCGICAVPLFHVTGSHHIFISSFPAGRKLCLMYKWDPAEALRLIEVERATFWTGVPTMVQDLIEHPDFQRRDTSSLKSIGGGGAPTAPALVPKVNKRFKGTPSNGYGLTETNGAVCGNSGQDYLDNPGSCGKPFPNVEAKVIDLDTGADLGSDARGELLLRSSLVMLHYHNKPEKTKEVLTEDGWFRTGDIATINPAGFIFIVDRLKDIVIRGGENISCTEVENAFYAGTSAIMECTAFGVPDERLGEEIALMVFLKKGEIKATIPDMLASVAGTLANFKTPQARHVFIIDNPLPRGATGKIQKAQVRKDAAALLALLGSKSKL